MLELLLTEAAVEAAAFNSSEHPVKVKEELMASCCFPSVVPAALARQALSLHSLLTKALRVAHRVAVVLHTLWLLCLSHFSANVRSAFAIFGFCASKLGLAAFSKSNGKIWKTYLYYLAPGWPP